MPPLLFSLRSQLQRDKHLLWKPQESTAKKFKIACGPRVWREPEFVFKGLAFQHGFLVIYFLNWDHADVAFFSLNLT